MKLRAIMLDMNRLVIVALTLLLPSVASAEVAAFVFTTSAQSIGVNTSSEVITAEAQDASGLAASGSTICMQLTSSSGSGTFSTNTSWSEPVSTLLLTLSSNQARRNFYYRNSAAGTNTLTLKAAPRPGGSTCTQWSPENGVSWSASHSIVVGMAPGTTADTATQASSTSQSATQAHTATQSSTVSSYVPPPEPVLYADAGTDRTVIVGADTEFRGRAYNKAKETITTARLHWNFGDGTTKEGSSVMHHFDYPGTYAVVLSVAQHLDSASDKIVVRAEPAQLGFYVHADGSVTIENNAGRDLDLSRWVVSAFMRDFLLPAGTEILAGSSVRISPQTLGFFAGLESTLKYPNGVAALSANQASATQAAPTAVKTSPATAAPVPQPRPAAHVEVADEANADSSEGDPLIDLNVAEAASATSGASYGGYWWLGALALAGLTSVGAVAVRRLRSKEWDIIEE